MAKKGYELEYLLAAQSDMTEIARYISKDLSNPDAAERLALKMIETGERIADFPYSCPVYTPIRPLRFEYRKAGVDNYLMFYTVDETKKKVTVARVIYAGRNYESLLG